MYLSSVRGRYFRNLTDLTVKLQPGLNVIVGENNIGRTNLMDAVRVALGPASVSGFLTRLDKDDRNRVIASESLGDAIRIDLLFNDLSTEEQAEFLECLNYDAGNPVASTASIHNEWSWSKTRQRYHARRWGSDRTTSETITLPTP